MQKLLYNRRAGAVLSGLAAGGRFPHALLLEGPAGCGKKTAAALIAQERLCTRRAAAMRRLFRLYKG